VAHQTTILKEKRKEYFENVEKYWGEDCYLSKDKNMSAKIDLSPIEKKTLK